MPSENTTTSDNLSFVLGSLARGPFSIRMTAHYQGLELKQDVRVLEANRKQVVFQATDLPACAILDGDIHLTSRIFPKAVVAQIMDRNVEKGILELSNFSFSESKWIERDSERLHPKNPTYLSLHCKQKAYRVFLEDISSGGMAVLVRKNPNRTESLHPGLRVYISGQLDACVTLENLKGALVYRKDVDPLLIKLGILIYPQIRYANLLDKYLADRKKEIFNEINQAYFGRGQDQPGTYLYL